MSARKFRGLVCLCVVSVLIGCGNPQGLDSVSISPTSQALTVGQTAQFSATGTFGNATHASTQVITGSVTWSSSSPSVATVSASGLATAVGAGSTTITASAAGYAGPVSSSATITVASSGGGGTAGGSISSISVIPGSQSVASPTQTSQFLAIGTTSSGATVNLTNAVVWSSSATQIATVGANTGLATAVGQGTATLTALYSNTGGTVVLGNATFNVTGGTTEKYTAVSITPNSQALSASGQTSQLVALGTSGTNGLLTDVSTSPQIKWTSSIPTIASVSPGGLVTGLSAGSSTITALLTNTDGTVVSSNATVNVAITPAPEPLLSLQIIPSSITVANLQDTGQFLAIGTYATAPYVRDLTNSPNLKWISAFPSVFPVNTNTAGNAGSTAGIVTAYGNGSGIIIAEAINPADLTIQTATATFNCPAALANPNGNPPTPATCEPGTQAPALLATLTVYNEGPNTTTWEVTAPSATGQPNVIHCGPGWSLNPAPNNTGGSVCVATYPVPAANKSLTVVVEESQPSVPTGQGTFGGWSYNCVPSDATGNTLNAPPITAAGPNYCAVTFYPTNLYDSSGNLIRAANTNVTVGAIFN